MSARRSQAVEALPAAAALTAAAVLLGGCDQVRTWFRPELGACERFVQSRMRVPTSYARQRQLISDILVNRTLLAEASGRVDDAAFARATPAPVVRDVFVQYSGDDGNGGSVTSAARCRFAMADGRHGTYLRDLDASADQAIAENEARTLDMSTGTRGVVAADCCLAKGFDGRRLDGLRRARRGEVKELAVS